MDSTIPVADLLEDHLFRAQLASAIYRHGGNSVCVLTSGEEFCPACGFQIPSQTRQAVLQDPGSCENCSRVLVDEHSQYTPLFTPLFTQDRK